MRELINFNVGTNLKKFIEDDRLVSLYDYLYNVYKFQKGYKQDTKILKSNMLQCFCVDKNMLHIGFKYIGNGRSIAETNCTLFGEDNFRGILEEKKLNINFSHEYEYPVLLREYRKVIPSSVLENKKNIDKILLHLEMEYYVSDVYDNPDPVLILQVKNDPNKTFVLGVWE